MAKTSKPVVPKVPVVSKELENYTATKKQLSAYEKVKQFFNQFNLF